MEVCGETLLLFLVEKGCDALLVKTGRDDGSIGEPSHWVQGVLPVLAVTLCFHMPRSFMPLKQPRVAATSGLERRSHSARLLPSAQP